MKRPIFLFVFLGCLTASVQAEPPTFFIVRHAERADAASGSPAKMASDPDLSETGRARAESLGGLRRAAGVTAKETAALIAKLQGSAGNALIIGHANTLPEIIKGLGVSTPIAIAESEYDNLFVVTAGSPGRLIHLHYR